MVRRRELFLGLAATPLLCAADSPPLSEAQLLLFETPHLAALHTPLRLDYAFRREEEGRDPVEDSIRLSVMPGAEPGRYDVAAEFLTGARAIHYPLAPGFRGNPLLLFALDRDSRELSAATGGTPGWFRNRIRRAFVDAAVLRRTTTEIDGRISEATEVSITPFSGEPRARRYQDMRFTFLLSEAVPGWVQAIRTGLPAGEGGGAVQEHIVFTGSVPLESAR